LLAIASLVLASIVGLVPAKAAPVKQATNRPMPASLPILGYTLTRHSASRRGDASNSLSPYSKAVKLAQPATRSSLGKTRPLS
jgi:hypothetical protein